MRTCNYEDVTGHYLILIQLTWEKRLVCYIILQHAICTKDKTKSPNLSLPINIMRLEPLRFCSNKSTLHADANARAFEAMRIQEHKKTVEVED